MERIVDGASEVLLDDRLTPILIATWWGGATERTIDGFHAWVDQHIALARASGTKLALVNDSSEAERPSPAARRRFIERPLDGTILIALPTLVTSPLVRGAMTAVGWVMGERMKPVTSHATLIEALAPVPRCSTPACERRPARASRRTPARAAPPVRDTDARTVASLALMPPWVLFLDFDGVLNGTTFLRHQRNHLPPDDCPRLFDPVNLAALDQLCVRLGIEQIVVTSTWRIGRPLTELRAMLAYEGFPRAERLIAVTPDLGDGIAARPAEIASWAASHGPLRALVLDDAPLALRRDFVRVDASCGLTFALVDAIVAARS